MFLLTSADHGGVGVTVHQFFKRHEMIGFVLIMVGIVASFMYTYNVAKTPSTGIWHAIIVEFSSLLQIENADPAQVLLRALNVTTFWYAIYFYLVRGPELGVTFAAFCVLFLSFLSILSYTVGFQITLEHPFGYSHLSDGILQNIFLISEYMYAVLITIFFAIADRLKSNRTSDVRESALLMFSSLYLSLPAVLTLILVAVFYLCYIDPSPATIILELIMKGQLVDKAIPPNPRLEYLAGAAAAVLFLTNVILAVATVPWYADKLDVRLARLSAAGD